MTESKEINSFARLKEHCLCQTALPFFISIHPWSVDTSPNKSWPFVLERVAVIHAHGHPPCHVGLSRDNLRGDTLISVCSRVHPVLMMSADRLSVFHAHAHCSDRQYASCLAQTIYGSSAQSGSNNVAVIAYMPEKCPRHAWTMPTLTRVSRPKWPNYRKSQEVH